MGPGGNVRMVAGRASADGGASCRSALAAYAEQPGGAYWRDVEGAVAEAYAALGIIFSAEGGEAGAEPGAGAGGVRAGAPRGVVVFDVDETALSNLPLASPLPPRLAGAAAPAAAAVAAAASATGAAASSPALLLPTARFSAEGARLPPSWSARDDADPSPALVPTLRLYGALQRQGLAAAFVTGRGEAARGATERNLLAAGYGGVCGDKGGGVGDRGDKGGGVGGGGDKSGGGGGSGAPCYLSLTLRRPGDARPASVYKPEARRALAAATGLPVVGSVGDQWSDLSGELGAGGAPGAAAPYVAIKLPNPFYYIL